jgi:hypothetical protein
MSILDAMDGFCSISRLNTHAVIPSVVMGVSAVTVAVLGPWSMREISPKKSPGPILFRARPPTETLAVPSVIRKKPTPESPSRASTAPSRWLISFADWAIARSSFLERPSNSGTSESSFTRSVATSRSFASIEPSVAGIVSEWAGPMVVVYSARMDPEEVIDKLARASRGEGSSPELKDTTDAAVEAIVSRFGERRRTEVGAGVYSIEEVTWPVSQAADGSSAFPDPIPVPTLIRGDVVLKDVRSPYWDGKYDYGIVGDRIGRWRRFRMGSPGDRGYDLRLATDEDRLAFAEEARALMEALGTR